MIEWRGGQFKSSNGLKSAFLLHFRFLDFFFFIAGKPSGLITYFKIMIILKYLNKWVFWLIISYRIKLCLVVLLFLNFRFLIRIFFLLSPSKQSESGLSLAEGRERLRAGWGAARDCGLSEEVRLFCHTVSFLSSFLWNIWQNTHTGWCFI